MRLVYLGSPDAAVKPLQALVAAGHEVLLVVSQPDRKRGRGATLLPSPVKAAANALGLTVSDRVADIEAAVAAGAELGVVVAFGQLIRQPVLDLLPFVNLHFSLLPRWRGAAPVERAILAGDRETGVCLMGLKAGLDTGPVYETVTTAIEDADDLATLRNRLVDIGTEMLLTRLAGGFSTLGTAEPQKGESTYATKLDPSEFLVEWSETAASISRLSKLGTAYTLFRGKRLKLLRVDTSHESLGAPGSLRFSHDGVWVAAGVGAVRLAQVQPEGKGPMDAQSWRNGAKPTENDVMGQ